MLVCIVIGISVLLGCLCYIFEEILKHVCN